jgi:hypothetical protein
MAEDDTIAKMQAHIAIPVKLPPDEQDAFNRAMRNCYIDTCDEDSLNVLARNIIREIPGTSSVNAGLARRTGGQEMPEEVNGNRRRAPQEAPGDLY